MIAWRSPGGENCGVPRRLFYFDFTRPKKPEPTGSSFIAGFGTRVKEVASEHAGREIVLDEYWAREDEAYCCPSIHRRWWYRYSESRDRYVVYRWKTTSNATTARR